MSDGARFHPQGKGFNALPHTLTAFLEPDWSRGVRWAVQCPYEGSERPCALLVECTEHERPTPPYPAGWMSEDPEARDYWDHWEAADERWQEDHDAGPYHPSDECWVRHMIDQGDCEPDYYLAALPRGRMIDGPIRVQVGQVGYGEEAKPVFRIWDDKASGDESR